MLCCVLVVNLDFVLNLSSFEWVLRRVLVLWVLECLSCVFYAHADEIAKLFPSLYGQPSAMLVPSDSSSVQVNKKLKIGVVLSGGQAPGGHNVISGLFGRFLFCPHLWMKRRIHVCFSVEVVV